MSAINWMMSKAKVSTYDAREDGKVFQVTEGVFEGVLPSGMFSDIERESGLDHLASVSNWQDADTRFSLKRGKWKSTQNAVVFTWQTIVETAAEDRIEAAAQAIADEIEAEEQAKREYFQRRYSARTNSRYAVHDGQIVARIDSIDWGDHVEHEVYVLIKGQSIRGPYSSVTHDDFTGRWFGQVNTYFPNDALPRDEFPTFSDRRMTTFCAFQEIRKQIVHAIIATYGVPGE